MTLRGGRSTRRAPPLRTVRSRREHRCGRSTAGRSTHPAPTARLRRVRSANDRRRSRDVPPCREAACVRAGLLRLAAVEPYEGPLRHARHGQGTPYADCRALRDAVTSTFGLRDTPLPTTLPDPPTTWVAPWATYVRDYGIDWTTLDQAVAALRPFWSPITSPSDELVTWKPEPWAWRPLV